MINSKEKNIMLKNMVYKCKIWRKLKTLSQKVNILGYIIQHKYYTQILIFVLLQVRKYEK